MEFENLQIEVPTGDEASQYLGVKVYEKQYYNKSKGFVIGFDPNSKENIERKKRRANRFGNKTIQPVTAPSDNGNDTRRFLKIDVKSLIWPSVPVDVKEEIRLNAILLYGVDHMSTTDVFEYFQLFGPETIEWIDDYTCNVVWDDDTSVLNALETLSKTFGKLLELQNTATREASAAEGVVVPPLVPVMVKEEDEDEVITHYENQILIPPDEEEIDPKSIWRVGLPYKKYQLFLRYATKQDRKLPGAAQRSEYYLKYGRNPNNTQNGYAGVLSNSRKRKLEKMQKLAVERFKMKEPDVKIVDLKELKSEGIISKMEVDEDEPIIKRINNNESFNGDTFNDFEDRIPPMTMVADKVEIQQRLGERYTSSALQNRLGTPLPHDDEDEKVERTGRIHDRLGVHTLDHIGRRNNNDRTDARHEIYNHHSTRHNNQTYISGGGYVDEYGDYHDVYRAADDIKVEVEAKKEDKTDEHLYNSRHNQNSIRDRLGTSREGTPSSVSDLRIKLRSREMSRFESREAARGETFEEEIKEENDGEKVNLCIEIKQEVPDPPTPMDDAESDFEF